MHQNGGVVFWTEISAGGVGVEIVIVEQCQVIPNINYFCHLLIGALDSTGHCVCPLYQQVLGFHSNKVAWGRGRLSAGHLLWLGAGYSSGRSPSLVIHTSPESDRKGNLVSYAGLS